MTLIASDGYEYADIAQRLLGRPIKNTRNHHITALRYRQISEGYIRAWYEGHDSLGEDALGGKRWASACIAANVWASAHPGAVCEPRRPG